MTSWLRLARVALPWNPAPLEPTAERSWPPLMAGLPFVEKVPESRLVPGAEPASMNEKVPT